MNHQEIDSIVVHNYETWKGQYDAVIRNSSALPAGVSPYFRVLRYNNVDYNAYCTVGASYNIIPHSQDAYGSKNGVRFEYIMHGKQECEIEIYRSLLLISGYPYLTNTMYVAGYVLPLTSSIVDSSKMQYMYFTYPYLDDPKIYDPPCCGEIESQTLLIQTLWVFPIHKSEARHIRIKGADSFEKELYNSRIKVHDFFRQSIF